MSAAPYLKQELPLKAMLGLALLLSAFSWVYFSNIGTTASTAPTNTLHQEAAAYQQSLQERLRIAEQTLALIAHNPYTPSLVQLASPYFKNINLVNTDGQVTPLLGVQLQLPDQSEAINIHLARGEPALLTTTNPSGATSIILLRGLIESDHLVGVVTAELTPEYLWLNHLHANNNLLVLNQQGQLLHASGTATDKELVAVLQQPKRTTSGELEWTENSAQWHASYTALPMHDRYASSDWSIVAAQPMATITSNASLQNGLMTAGIGLALLLAWGLTLRLHLARKPDGFKKGGAPGTQMMAFQPLDIVRAMDEFDRAILSNASFNNVIDLVFTHVPKVIPCVVIAVTHLDDSTIGHSTLVNNLDNTQPIELPKLDKALRDRLDTEPNGCQIDNPEQLSFIKPLAELGAARFQLFPIYRDSVLSGILHFGLPEDKWLSESEHYYARSFADRLGVALTSVMRSKELYLQEHFDAVTGLPNRAFCRDRLSQEISRARRKKLLIAVININLSGFKKINDSLGYAGGDDVLNQVAQRLKATLRESDVIARFGNDEFVIVLPDINNANEISKVAGKLTDAFTQNFTYEANNVHVNAALGISLYPNDGQTIDHLLHHAEVAMTRIKSSGHTQFVFYEEHMNSRAVERLKLEHDLRQALQEDQLFLVYQPQIDLRSGKIAGVEALVRWQHPTRGLVNPGEFISIAEETGLIIKMSEIIRQIACKQYVAWKAKELAPPRIAINVSGQDLRRKTFPEEVVALLKEHGVPTEAIELEITESMFVDATGGVVDMLRGLQSEGFLIAIDDFGTGYSSLSYLGLLPFDILKVDRSFVLGIGKPAEKIVSVIVDVAHTFEKKVIAEGVDSDHQHKYLEELGCEIIQGFLFSKPLLPSDFENYAMKMAA